ncbi:MAG: cation:proton antiporter [Candidatus Omnitrophica bacterium]|nr:cation:proton antiporter [Candidatus Omnitrophota bacterium]
MKKLASAFLLSGIFFARFFNKLGFPAVTAYLVLGILIGPYVFNLAPKELLNASGLISNIVLGMIAFGIGQNFSIDNFRRLGKSILWISVLETSGAWVFVTLAFLIILRQPFYISFLFGAIASATAPAATVMVIREYRAKGFFTNTLLGVVAIDDAWCLIIFAISLAISKAIYNHLTSPLFLLKVFWNSLFSISGAFILGSILAFILSHLSKYIRSLTELLIYTLGFVLFSIGVSLSLHLSVLLSCMFLGAALVNIHLASFKFFDAIRTIDSPLFLLFFVLAGANLEIPLLKKLGLWGLVYIIFRVLGKVIGANWGAEISKSSPVVKKYLGFGLVPQAGVALGCALIAKSDFPNIGNILFTTIVGTTVIYELIGPFCTKYALHKAGEIVIGY